MALIDDIRAAQLQARKNKNTIKSTVLTTLIGEADAVGKKSNRAPNDKEVIETLKKFIKNINETLAVCDALSADVYAEEKKILAAFLPTQLTEDELRSAIKTIVDGLPEKNAKAMGAVQQQLKAQFEGLYDGKTASTITKELLA